MSNTPFNYELLFDLSPDLLIIAGFDGYFKKVNPAVVKALGYSLEELYARPINEFIHEEDRDRTSIARQQLAKAKPLVHFENRYITKKGEVIWLSWTSYPIENEKVVFAIAKDITHKKRMETQRNVQLAELIKTNQDLKQLTYTSSHDLRSPVNNLLAIFSLIETDKISDEETLQLIDFLKSTGENLKQSLDKYVDVLSERHTKQANWEVVSLKDSLQTVLKSINTLMEDAKASLTVDFEKVDTVLFNKAFMESVWLNLLTNAIKYRKLDASPQISIRSEVVSGMVRIVFSDNGLGFDMEAVKDKIFGAHQRFHQHTDSKGIGLYLVHSHITSLGGKIEVDSHVNEGTTFTIYLKNTDQGG
ncbi:PAS domain-containing sensor histidine kinase [Cytophagales bacterium LB-30]|uniref:histidine kinase n=1 Tax=Shiella aurantiaca TaxID=3058365 RepID=A0ABT8F438_9BACT|nr:PAS domain-containing sensor histidine kinase [Shiella aurantiaca]MDN4165063.1 PAS domain-containing sensor histidine kinase [Shiella aurantiaca]